MNIIDILTLSLKYTNIWAREVGKINFNALESLRQEYIRTTGESYEPIETATSLITKTLSAWLGQPMPILRPPPRVIGFLPTGWSYQKGSRNHNKRNTSDDKLDSSPSSSLTNSNSYDNSHDNSLNPHQSTNTSFEKNTINKNQFIKSR